ncbi:NAD-dependent epimerase/dehydratase family protein [Fontimonas thermophila]|nr:NAD-dependent epimerase/dehydratase family protein [Fontimonas thermophila]
MHTILGANGQIGRELARVLAREFTREIRLVSRQPQRVNDTDQVHRADLLDASQTCTAVAGAAVVYLTAGLPMDTQRWVAQWPVIMRNVIDACIRHGARLVFFDNTYMYPQHAAPLTEDTPFAPHGEKGRVRAAVATMLLEAMAAGRITALIGRAPEFYGPGLTQSITQRMVIDPLKRGRPAKVPLRDDTLRTLIYTPDASRALAWLGNAPDTYGQTWHLPCDDERLTYRGFVERTAAALGVAPRYTVVRRWQFHLAGLFDAQIRDAAELLPRYAVDHVFVSDKFKRRFPDFPVTRYAQGLCAIAVEARATGTAASWNR